MHSRFVLATTLVFIAACAFMMGCEKTDDAGKTDTASTDEPTTQASGPEDEASVTLHPGDPDTAVFSIEGMSCDGCVATVQAAIEDVDGVVACEVTLEPGKALVKTDGRDLATIITAAINKAGYGVPPATEDVASPDDSSDGA